MTLKKAFAVRQPRTLKLTEGSLQAALLGAMGSMTGLVEATIPRVAPPKGN